MADVIPLAPHLRPAPERSERADSSASAAILFFTGVRYDRAGETEAIKPIERPAVKRRAPGRPRRSKSAAGQPA